MTHREQLTTDPGPPRSVEVPAPETFASDAEVKLVWEKGYGNAPREERQVLLPLVGRFRASSPTSPEESSPASLPAKDLLVQVLQGKTEALSPFPAPALALLDDRLDEIQQQAVAGALGTPDLFLICGLPGTGKSRVVTEIIRQACQRGERILLTAPTRASVDCILERLVREDALCPIRCLDPEETIEALAPCIGQLTFSERVRLFHERSLPGAQKRREEAQDLLERRRHDVDIWDRLHEFALRLTEIQNALNELDKRQGNMPGEAETHFPLEETGQDEVLPFYRDVLHNREEAIKKVEQRQDEIRSEQEKIRRQIQQHETEQATLGSLIEARRSWRVWSASFWMGWVRADLPSQLTAREQELAECKKRLETLACEEQSLAEELVHIDERFQRKRQKLIESERQSLEEDLRAQTEALTEEQRHIREKWQTTCRELSEGIAFPEAETPEALQAARKRWQDQLLQDEQTLTETRHWALALEQAAPHYANKLLEQVSVVAGTPAALSRDPHFGQGPGDDGGDSAPFSFDLLIVEDAHWLTPADLESLATRARRYVLVGEPWHGERRSEDGSEKGPSSSRSARPRRYATERRKAPPAPTRIPVFHELWRQLHTNPRQLPYLWVLHEGRLRCRLQAITPEEERWVETERVADRPEIELRILAEPRSEPKLFEIAFPPTMPAQDAKGYVFTELQELAVHTYGEEYRWEQSDDGMVLQFSSDPFSSASQHRIVSLEAGVEEVVVPQTPPKGLSRSGAVSWHTACLRFAGWPRDRAVQWVEEKIGLRDLGRTASFQVAYRSPPLLTRFLSDLFFGGVYREAAGGVTASPPVHFVSVPPLSELLDKHPNEERGGHPRGREGRGHTAMSSLRAVRGGGGLEFDLADTRARARLPNDLRISLPARGLVNFEEAQAVVQVVETILADSRFRIDGEAWQGPCPISQGRCPQPASSPGTHVSGPHRVALGVIALYPAQAELINLLLERSTLDRGALRVQVGLPQDFHQRDTLITVVSLTRSHTHRAVSYGEGPDFLVQAFTRANSRLILVGDVGTLVRRSQWQGPLDHLDSPSARRERAVIEQLVRYVQGKGPHPKAFQVRSLTPQSV
jgi:hypothetical protein